LLRGLLRLFLVALADARGLSNARTLTAAPRPPSTRFALAAAPRPPSALFALAAALRALATFFTLGAALPALATFFALGAALRPLASLFMLVAAFRPLASTRGYGRLGALAPEMPHHEVNFLDARRVLARDDEAEIAALREAGAARARHAEHRKPPRARSLDRGEHVGRTAARRHRDEKISFLAESLDLPREHAPESGIVPDRGDERAVRGEGDRRQGAAIPEEAAHQLGREVLGLGGAPAVPAKEDRLAARRRLGEPLRHSLEERFLPLQGFRQESRARGDSSPDRPGSAQAASPPATPLRDAR
jgi:hypothetical protein